MIIIPSSLYQRALDWIAPIHKDVMVFFQFMLKKTSNLFKESHAMI